MARWWGERCRAAASPGAIKALMEMNSRIDVRAVLAAIRVPTLVVNRGTDFDVRVEEGRYIAERIAGARFVELPGADHFVAIDADQILDAVEPFLAECGAAPLPVHWDRALVTLLITEIVGSTRRPPNAATVPGSTSSSATTRWFAASWPGSAAMSSRRRATGRSPRSTAPRARSAARRRSCARSGRSGSTPGPACIRARWRCRAIASAASPFRSRQRVAAEAAPGEVLVSQTVDDLVAGSGLEFADRGRRALAGVPGEWRLLAVVDVARI